MRWGYVETDTLSTHNLRRQAMPQASIKAPRTPASLTRVEHRAHKASRSPHRHGNVGTVAQRRGRRHGKRVGHDDDARPLSVVTHVDPRSAQRIPEDTCVVESLRGVDDADAQGNGGFHDVIHDMPRGTPLAEDLARPIGSQSVRLGSLKDRGLIATDIDSARQGSRAATGQPDRPVPAEHPDLSIIPGDADRAIRSPDEARRRHGETHRMRSRRGTG